MVRKERNFFFGPAGTPYSKFSVENIPTEQRYRQLFQSVLFPAEVADTAKLNEAGHVKLAADDPTLLRFDDDADGHRRVVQPHQLPNIYNTERTEHTLLSGTDNIDHGIRVRWLTYDDGTDKRLDFGIRAAVEHSLEINSNGNIQFLNDQGSPGAYYYYGTNASGVKGYHALNVDPGGGPPSLTDELVKVGPAGTATYLSSTFFKYETTGIEIVDCSITEVQLSASVAGAGLTGGCGSPLAVNVDSSTLIIDGDTIKINEGGVTNIHLDPTVAGVGLIQAGDKTIALNPDVTNGTSFIATTDGARLDGDLNTPPANYLYGTNAAGVKGWYPYTAVSGNNIIINDQADNRMISCTAVTDTLQAEANLLFNGSALRVLADINFEAADRQIEMVTPTASNDGYHLSILGSAGFGTNKNGGDINIAAGAATGVGTDGTINIGYHAGTSIFQGKVQFGGLETIEMGWWGATPVPRDSNTWTITNDTPVYTLDCDSTNEDEIADILGTLIGILKNYGILK